MKSGEDYSFAKAIFPGVKHPEQRFGVFAGGRDSYQKYAALLDPIINDYHKTDSTQRFKAQTMQDILDGGATNYTGSVKNPGKRWDYFDQSLVKNVRVEAVRNMDQMPTLAGLTETSAAELVEIQAKVLEGLQAQPETAGEQLNFTQIAALSAEQKAALTAKGVILQKDKHYYTVVPKLTDEQRFVLHNDKFALMVNFPYEQFRFIVNQPGGSIEEAVRLMQKGIEKSKEMGAKYGMLATKSWLCCNLANLGGFQIRLTLNFKLSSAEHYKAL